MASVLNKSSPLVTAEVTIAGVKVVALIDTGDYVVLLQVGLVQPVQEPPGSSEANQHSSDRRRECTCGAQRHN